MKITVTQEDIDQGIISCSGCPLALALSRALARPISVSFANWTDKPMPVVNLDDWHPLPETARLFRSAFDAGFPVQPFDFELELWRAKTSTEIINQNNNE